MRRRVDFLGLPRWARYGLALVILAAVVGIVLLVRPDAGTAGPATWYTVLVRIGAVALLLFLLCWLGWRAARLVRRR
jgi:hypothetical protein